MNTVTSPLVLQVSPNPFLKRFRVRVASTKSENGSLNLLDREGQAILRELIVLQPGMNEIDLETGDLPLGPYYLHYKTQTTGIFIVMKLFKN